MESAVHQIVAEKETTGFTGSLLPVMVDESLFELIAEEMQTRISFLETSRPDSLPEAPVTDTDDENDSRKTTALSSRIDNPQGLTESGSNPFLDDSVQPIIGNQTHATDTCFADTKILSALQNQR